MPLTGESPSTPLSQLATGVFGMVENSAVLWAAAQTGPGVSAVRLRLPSGATDQMAPVDGVAVLAHGTSTAKPPPDGAVLEALDGSGKVIGSQDLTQEGPQRLTACAVATASGSSAAATASAPPTTR